MAQASNETEHHRRLDAHKKTRMCKFFLMGTCTRGRSCNFAHGASQLREQPDFSKTRLCAKYMESGFCPLGYRCSFAHGRHELRPRRGAPPPPAPVQPKPIKPTSSPQTSQAVPQAPHAVPQAPQAVPQAPQAVPQVLRRAPKAQTPPATPKKLAPLSVMGSPTSAGSAPTSPTLSMPTIESEVDTPPKGKVSFSRQSTWEGPPSTCLSRQVSNSRSFMIRSAELGALLDQEWKMEVKNTFINLSESKVDERRCRSVER
ncbi:unnamed protein product [Durusdinium trenchii]|uniref:C3H1-type domain-containing protein n=1 Tax=Durusdinium trenchii TaxID=1381693 RepID=A0ABP0L111_9DINO